MTDRQAQLRNAKARERQAKREAGLVRVEVWVPEADRHWVKTAMSAFKQAVINDPDGRIRDWDGVRACLQCIAEGLKGEIIKSRVR